MNNKLKTQGKKTAILITICICSLLMILIYLICYCFSDIKEHTPTINGTKQWVEIIGKDKDKPVLLFLHGGPGGASSEDEICSEMINELKNYYRIVLWDQRQSGRSYYAENENIEITYDLLMKDGEEVTKYILEKTGANKITLLGHSWGSCYAANLAINYPEYYNCFIGTGMLVDVDENEALFKNEAEKWATESETMSTLFNEFQLKDYLSQDYFKAKSKIIHFKFTGNLEQEKNLPVDTKYYKNNRNVPEGKASSYDNFLLSGEYRLFSLKSKTDFDIPFYILQGENDYQTMTQLAKEYYNDINTKTGGFYTIKDKYHSILTGQTDDIIQIIEAIYREVYENSK